MAKYTTLVRSICEQKAGLEESKGFNNIDSIIDASWDKIFTTRCTFFDENYRSVLCKKILKHYYTKEIGLETVGLWQLFMNRKLEEIMPYYNKLYNSELIQFDPMTNMNLSKTRSKAGQEAGSVNSTGGSTLSETILDSKNVTSTEETDRDVDSTVRDSGTSQRDINRTRDNDIIDTGASRDAYSDTPQGGISNVEDNTYLTNFRKITDNRSNVTDESEVTNDDVTTSNTSTLTEYDDKAIDYEMNEADTRNKMNSATNTNETTNTLSTTENYIESVIGNNGSYNFSRLLQDFRETFLNIDMLVINEFKGMFMGLW